MSGPPAEPEPPQAGPAPPPPPPPPPAAPAPQPAPGSAPTADTERTGTRFRLPLGIAAVTAPVIAGVVAIATTFSRPLYVFTGDQAVLALGVNDALGLHATVGPYSRFGWSHPGPALSYLLAPVYSLSGHDPRSFFLSSFVINGLAAIGVVAAVRLRAGEWTSRVTAALVCCAVLAAGVTTVTYFWNPDVEALPLLLTLVLAAASFAGSGLSVVGMLIVGSYCVQTDVGTAPTVALVSVLGALGFAIDWWRRRGERRANQRDYQSQRDVIRLAVGTLGVGLLVVMWIPPLHQQLDGRPGNLSQIIDFFLGHTHGSVGVHHHPLGVAVDAIASTTTQLPYGGNGAIAVLHTASTGQLTVFWVSVAIAVGATVAAALRRNLFALGLALSTLIGVAAAVFAATRVVGDIYPYLLSWGNFLFLPAWLAAGWLVVDGVRRLTRAGWAKWRPGRHAPAGVGLVWVRRVVSAVVALALLAPPAALAYQLVSQRPGGGDNGDTPVSVLAAFARTSLGSSAAARSPLVEINSGPSWPVAAGLVWQLEREGLHPRVQPQWGFMFGTARVDRRVPQAVLALQAAGTLPPALRAGPGVLTVNDPLYGPTTLTVTAPPGTSPPSPGAPAAPHTPTTAP